MIEPSQLEDIVNKISAAIPQPIKELDKSLKEQIRTGVQQALRDLEFVSREEFDVQRKVLAKSRAMLEDLTERVATLEGQQTKE